VSAVEDILSDNGQIRMELVTTFDLALLQAFLGKPALRHAESGGDRRQKSGS
jgi:hypothetical protein